MPLPVIFMLGAAMSGQADALLAPELMTRDVPVVIEVMDLDEDQAAVLDTLFHEYLERVDAARADTDGRGGPCDMADQDRRRRRGNAGHIVVFRHPVAVIAKPFGMAGKVHRIGQGLRGS